MKVTMNTSDNAENVKVSTNIDKDLLYNFLWKMKGFGELGHLGHPVVKTARDPDLGNALVLMEKHNIQ